MSGIVINDAETRRAWEIANPELEGLLTKGSRISFIYSVNDDEDQEERVHFLAQQHINDSIPENRFLVYNLLSTQWTYTKFKRNPIAYPFLYFFGMVSYAISLPIRISILAYALFRWALGPFLAHCHSENINKSMKQRTVIFMGAIGEFLSGVVGMFCPPLAYALDEWIQSNPTIHEWYNSHRFSQWSDNVENEENEERAIQKNEAVKEDVKYFQRAKEDLGRCYLSEEQEVSSMTPAAMELIMHFGFLDIFCSYCKKGVNLNKPVTLEDLKDTPLEQYCVNALEACLEENIRKNTEECLLESIVQFRKYWVACHSPAPSKEILEHLTTAAHVAIQSPRKKPNQDENTIYQAIKAALLLNLGTSVIYSAETTKGSLNSDLNMAEELEVSLGTVTITGRDAAYAMAGAIQKFSSTIKNTDRTMERVILRNAYE